MTIPDTLNFTTPEPLPPPPAPSNPPTVTYNIFFITGNPGLIAYYTPFLSTLASLLSTTSTSPAPIRYRIRGHSLAGFTSTTSFPPSPYGLAQQISLAAANLTSFLAPPHRSDDNTQRTILIGHSVGAYILLELVRRSPRPILGGILLFPTVTHIAQSPSGQKLTVRLSSVSPAKGGPRVIDILNSASSASRLYRALWPWRRASSRVWCRAPCSRGWFNE